MAPRLAAFGADAVERRLSHDLSPLSRAPSEIRHEISAGRAHARFDVDRDAHADAELRLAGGSSMRTRIGMRCTTLTQLPLVFCAGSSEKLEAEAGLMLSTVPVHSTTGIAVDADRRRLAGPHIGQLGLLRVRRDPEIGRRHQAERLL